MGNLFNKYYLNEYIEAYRKSLRERIDRFEITNTTDIDNLVEKLEAEFTIHPIVIGEPLPSEPRETTRQMRNMWDENYQQKVFEINVIIPFEGNHELFYCKASTSQIVYLDKSASINTTHVTAKIILDNLDDTKYRSELNKIIGTLNSNLPTIKLEINPWNNGLKNFIKELIEARKGVVSKKIDFMEKIGLKVNPKSTEFLVPPTIKKKTIPTPVGETTKTIKREIIPILQEEVYRDIRDVLYNVGKALERKPSIYVIGKQQCAVFGN